MSKRTKKTKSTKLKKILLIPDSHHPYVDKNAWNLMLKAAKVFGPDEVVIMGDFADFYAVSSHSKDPNRAFKLKEEIDATKKALDQVKTLGADNYHFVSGNHEDRLERYLRDKAPDLYNFISIPKVLELKEKGFSYTPYKQSLKIGKLNITHDTGTAGRYAHYKSLDTFQHNVVIGHTHRIGYCVEGDSTGARHLGAMLGWLGDLDEVDYMHMIKARKDWSHGFGIAYMDPKTEAVYVIPVPIINGTVVIEGKLVTL